MPPSTIDGERLSERQPYPVKPPPFARQGLTEDMLTTRTPEAHAAVLAQFRKLADGLLRAAVASKARSSFPASTAAAEWGGAAFDPESALLYVNSNEMPWIVRAHSEQRHVALHISKCATCHREDRTGTPQAPSLVGIGERRTRDEIATIVREGTGRMPANPDMGARNIGDLAEFLITGRDKGRRPGADARIRAWLKYRSDGETLWRDPDGYPPITPPWGTLNAIDLNAGHDPLEDPVRRVSRAGRERPDGHGQRQLRQARSSPAAACCSSARPTSTGSFTPTTS